MWNHLVVGVGVVGGAFCYHRWQNIPVKKAIQNNCVVKAVRRVFSHFAWTLCLQYCYKVNRKQFQYANLPQEDKAFVNRIVDIYARTLTAEQKDALIQNHRENDPDLISAIMNLSWRALVLSPDSIGEQSCPPYLRSYRGGGSSWGDLPFLRRQFRMLSAHDQQIFLEHPDPEDISQMPISESAKELYRGIKAIADLYIQGNNAFTECLGIVFKEAVERGRLLEEAQPTSNTSKTGWPTLFTVFGGSYRVESKYKFYADLPIGSPSALVQEFLRRYRAALPPKQLLAFEEEIADNQLYARKVILLLSIRAIFCAPNPQVFVSAMSFFTPEQMATLVRLREQFKKLPLIDRNYIFSNILLPKDPDHPQPLGGILDSIERITAATLVDKRDDLQELVDPLVLPDK